MGFRNIQEKLEVFFSFAAQTNFVNFKESELENSLFSHEEKWGHFLHFSNIYKSVCGICIKIHTLLNYFTCRAIVCRTKKSSDELGKVIYFSQSKLSFFLTTHLLILMHTICIKRKKISRETKKWSEELMFSFAMD